MTVWHVDITQVVKESSNLTICCKNNGFFPNQGGGCPIFFVTFLVNRGVYVFQNVHNLNLFFRLYMYCMMYSTYGIFRCASISWFQVVSRSVSDIFLQLAHLRVFQIIHIALISNNTLNTFIWYLSFCIVIHIAGLPLWRPSLPLLEGSLCLFGMIWCYSTKCMFEVANKYEQIHYYLTWHDTVI